MTHGPREQGTHGISLSESQSSVSPVGTMRKVGTALQSRKQKKDPVREKLGVVCAHEM